MAESLIPFEVLIPLQKSEKDGEVVLDGPLSSNRRDLQGERMLRKALQSGLRTFAANGMPVDWNHFSKTKGDPKWRIGTGFEVYEGTLPGGQNVEHLKSRLHKGTEIADQVIKMAKAGVQLYYSVGGNCVKRDGDIVDSVIDHVAVTDTPANRDAAVGLSNLAKALSGGISADSFFGKTMCAGSGPGLDSEGGRALVTEDLEGDRKKKRARRRRIMRRLVMNKGIKDVLSDLADPEIQQELETISTEEKDSSAGVIAGLLKSIGTKLGLMKAGGDEDEEQRRQEEEDELRRQEEEELGKSFYQLGSAHIDPADQVLAIAPDVLVDRMGKKFEAVLAKALGAAIKPVLDANKALADDNKSLRDEIGEMKKAFEPVAEFADFMGKLPQKQTMRKGGNIDVQDGSQKQPLSKAQETAILEKAVEAGKLTGEQFTAHYIGSRRLSEPMLKSFEAQFGQHTQ